MRGLVAYESVKVVPAMRFTDMTAAGAGDNTEVQGATIDRQDNLDLVLVLTGVATLAATETISIVNIDIQESDDGAAFDTAVNLVATDQVVATGGGGGTTEDFAYHLKVDLGEALVRKRYLRFNVTYDLSAGATDTARAGASAVLLGARVKPQTKDELTA